LLKGPLNLDPRGKRDLKATGDAYDGLEALDKRVAPQGWPAGREYGRAGQTGPMGLLVFAREVLGYGADVGKLVTEEQLRSIHQLTELIVAGRIPGRSGPVTLDEFDSWTRRVSPEPTRWAYTSRTRRPYPGPTAGPAQERGRPVEAATAVIAEGQALTL